MVESRRDAPRILVIDDEPGFRDLLEVELSERGLRVTAVPDAERALARLESSSFDAVLCDLVLPGLGGLEALRHIKRLRPGLPVLIATGHGSLESAVEALRFGADDFLLKPLEVEPLAERLAACLGRSVKAPERRLRVEGLELDPRGRTVSVRGRFLRLARKEFDLLALLLKRPGRLLGVPALLKAAWGGRGGASTVEVHVCRLRRKLGAEHGGRIVNVLGHGYKFLEDGIRRELGGMSASVQRRETSSAGMQASPGAGTRRRALIVDDEPAIRNVLRRVLAALDPSLEIREAADGAQAAAELTACAPDLLLLDLQLPGRGGLELCRDVRADPVLSRARVVLMSGQATSETRSLALEAGADDFIAKPFDVAELKERLRALRAGFQGGAPE